MIKMLAVIAALGVVLSAQVEAQEEIPEMTLDNACRVVEVLMGVLTEYEATGQLDTSRQADLVEMREGVAPLCTGDLSARPSDAMDQVGRAIWQLVILRAIAEGQLE